jgi:hypothetical protein
MPGECVGTLGQLAKGNLDIPAFQLSASVDVKREAAGNIKRLNN